MKYIPQKGAYRTDTGLIKHFLFMAGLENHDYLKVCAELASSLSISLSSARRKVEIFASRDGIKDLESRKAIALRLLKEVQDSSAKGKAAAASQLDQLLVAVAEDENFMIED